MGASYGLELYPEAPADEPARRLPLVHAVALDAELRESAATSRRSIAPTSRTPRSPTTSAGTGAPARASRSTPYFPTRKYLKIC